MRAWVTAVHEETVALRGPMITGAVVDPYRSVGLEVEGVLVVVSSAETRMLDQILYRMLDIEPEQMKVLVNKSAVHFRAEFAPIASAILLAKSPRCLVPAIDGALFSQRYRDQRCRSDQAGTGCTAIGMSLASLPRFWAAAARWNSSRAPFGPIIAADRAGGCA